MNLNEEVIAALLPDEPIEVLDELMVDGMPVTEDSQLEDEGLDSDDVDA